MYVTARQNRYRIIDHLNYLILIHVIKINCFSTGDAALNRWNYGSILAQKFILFRTGESYEDVLVFINSIYLLRIVAKDGSIFKLALLFCLRLTDTERACEEGEQGVIVFSSNYLLPSNLNSNQLGHCYHEIQCTVIIADLQKRRCRNIHSEIQLLNSCKTRKD